MFEWLVDKALFAYIISLYIFTYREGMNQYSNYIAAVFMILAIFDVLRRKKRIQLNIFLFLFTTFILTCMVSFFAAIDKSLVIEKTKSLLLILTFLAVLTNYIDSRKKLANLVQYIVYSGVIASIYILINSDLASMERLGDVLGNENEMGMIISTSFLFSFYLYNNEKKPLYMIFCALMLLTVLLTGSRKSALLIVMGLLIYTYYTNSDNTKNRLKFIIIGILIVIAMYYLIFNIPVFYMVIGRRFEDLFSFVSGRGTREGSILMRDYMIKLGIELFAKKPVLGYGIDNYRILLAEASGVMTYSHNNYIELLVGTGIIGAIAFYLIYINCLISLKKLLIYRDCLIYMLYAINISVLILGLSLVHYSAKHFYIILAMSAIVSKMWEEKRMEEELDEN